MVTFTEKPESFTYKCYIGNVDRTMEVTIHLTETDPGITHKATINGTEYAYAVGEQVPLAADAFYTDKGCGYRFDKWEGSVDIADAAAYTTTFTMPAQDVTVRSSYYLIGDIDGNGVVDAMDAYDIIQMAVNKKTPTLVGDITGSGAVDAMSVSNIAKYIVGTYIPLK